VANMQRNKQRQRRKGEVGNPVHNKNRLLNITFPDNSTVSNAFDPYGNQTSVTDQRGHSLTKTYDAYERLSQVKDANNGITQFAYDTKGRLLTRERTRSLRRDRSVWVDGRPKEAF